MSYTGMQRGQKRAERPNGIGPMPWIIRGSGERKWLGWAGQRVDALLAYLYRVHPQECCHLVFKRHGVARTSL